MQRLPFYSHAMRHELFIEGMGCDHCIKSVDDALRKVEGVENVEVELGHAVVETAADLDMSKLRIAVESAGYQLKSG
jgi:copper chaperone